MFGIAGAVGRSWTFWSGSDPQWLEPNGTMSHVRIGDCRASTLWTNDVDSSLKSGRLSESINTRTMELTGSQLYAPTANSQTQLFILSLDGIIYLPEIKYRRILNKAFGPGGWGLAPRSETNVGPRIVSREYALVCLGRCSLSFFT